MAYFGVVLGLKYLSTPYIPPLRKGKNTLKKNPQLRDNDKCFFQLRLYNTLFGISPNPQHLPHPIQPKKQDNEKNQHRKQFQHQTTVAGHVLPQFQQFCLPPINVVGRFDGFRF
jgi:hypothetical protein